MPNDHEAFAGTVCSAFELGAPQEMERMPGGANVLWRFGTDTGSYVVKELPAGDFADLTRAAGFERAVYDTGRVRMAEPCPDRSRRYVRDLVGSRGLRVSVRVHRLVTGQPVTDPGPLAQQAGATLAVIQSLGRPFPSGENTRIWRSADQGLPARFGVPGAQEVLAEAEELVGTALAAGRPQFTHCDFKPVNCLLERDRLIVLDWDEANAYDPRLEAVESALRWSWQAGRPDPAVFAGFATGYQRGFPPLRRYDWAKWVSGLASWFEFMAASSLGAWPEIALEPGQAAAAARAALTGLTETLQKIPQWTEAINAALLRPDGDS